MKDHIKTRNLSVKKTLHHRSLYIYSVLKVVFNYSKYHKVQDHIKVDQVGLFSLHWKHIWDKWMLNNSTAKLPSWMKKQAEGWGKQT